MIKKDKLGNVYTLQKNGDVWLYLPKKGHAELLGQIKEDQLLVWRSSYHWREQQKGWVMAYPILLWKASFKFRVVKVQTAVSPKGHAFTGRFQRSYLKEHGEHLLGVVDQLVIRPKMLQKKI